MSARRDSVLREMGLAPLWRLRATAEGAAEQSVEPPAETHGGAPLGWVEGAPSSVREAAPAVARPSVVLSEGAAESTAPARPRVPAAPPAAAPRSDGEPSAPADPGRRERIAGLDWEALEADIRACRACRLCEKRKQAVPGVGDRQATWMLVGEAPGAEEDQRGEPFVGAAGKLLDAMLAAIGLKRGEGVYIANTVKCRPPLNRTPQPDEIATCFPYLERQIALVRPRILIALGRPAAQALLDTEVSIGGSRGRVFHYRDTPLVVTYHPAYLLRNQTDKAKAWEDLCFARRLVSAAGERSGA